jgi:hypothetical protein
MDKKLMHHRFLHDLCERGLDDYIHSNSLIIKAIEFLMIKDTKEENDNMIIPHKFLKDYHNAAIIASLISKNLKCLVVNGGITRELLRLYGKIVYNNEDEIYAIKYINYKLSDLDIHLTTDYEIDFKELIKSESMEGVLLMYINTLLENGSCMITKSLRDIKLINVPNNYGAMEGEEDIRKYILDVKVGDDVVGREEEKIKTDIVLYPKGINPDFVCNQICLEGEDIKEEKTYLNRQSDKYVQKFCDMRKLKMSMILNRKNLPSIIINKIIDEYLNIDVINKKVMREKTEKKLGCLYLNRESLMRCKLTSRFKIEDVCRQLARDETYFIGNCRETGCIPDKNIYTVNYPNYNWDKYWTKDNNLNILRYRLNKLKERGITVVNHCSVNNRKCLWFKNRRINNYKYKELFNIKNY